MRKRIEAGLRESQWWIRQAENERLHKRPRMAKSCLIQHIAWRESARRLAKQEKKP